MFSEEFLSFLPTLNGSLNAIVSVLLVCGWVFIKRKQEAAHKACMLAATALSALFLASYLVYHFHHRMTAFPGTGWSRPLYFTILITHVTLAAANLPLVIITLRLAIKGELERHKKIARFTMPIWLYVAMTGVLVYLMLYVWFPTK